ncbi:MAG: S1C family serine protease [Planctomycetota bacterium]
MQRASLRALTLLTVALLCCGSTAVAQQPAEETGFGKPIEKVVQKVSPSVVGVRVVESSEATGERGTAIAKKTVLLAASGLAISKNQIVTLFRDGVPEPEKNGKISIEVMLSDGEVYPATWKATDTDSGVTILNLKDAPRLKKARFSRKEPKQGSVVVAIGTGEGMSQSHHLGIISGPNRRLRHPALPRLIRVSLSSQPQDVGGVLVTDRGEIFGMLALTFSDPNREQGSLGRGRKVYGSSTNVTTTGGDNVVFAIPGDLLQAITKQLVKGKDVTRGALGASFSFVRRTESRWSKEGKLLAGVVVEDIEKKGSAITAGLLPGDLIAKVDQREMRTEADLYWFAERVQYGAVGTKLLLQIYRTVGMGQAVKTIEVPIGKAPKRAPQPY